MPELMRPVPSRPLADRVVDRVRGLLAGRRPVRVAAAGVGVALAGVAAWWLLRSPAASVEDRLPLAATARTTAAPVATTGPAGSSAPSAPVPAVAGPASTTGAEAGLVAQAAGAVVAPGIYRLTPGARVADLVASAGGPTAEADLDAVALAARLTDGQRVYVPRRGEVVNGSAGGDAAGGGAPAPPTAPTPDAPLDLNVATAEQLDLLPGVGPATAAAIVAYRNKHGPFRAVEELLEVRGIGAAKLDAVRDLVRV